MFDSIITKYTCNCIICGSPTVAKHHTVYGTAEREKADQDLLTLPLCPKHHNLDRKESVHLNPAIGAWSKICGQLAYEKHLIATENVTEEQARERFRKRYGKSYL
jgi:hypothetical protein